MLLPWKQTLCTLFRLKEQFDLGPYPADERVDAMVLNARKKGSSMKHNDIEALEAYETYIENNTHWN